MAKEVFYSVCYNDARPGEAIRSLHTFTPAILHGYCRHKVQFADYPAIIPEDGKSVRGVYVTGLTSGNMYHLDIFEGNEYEKKQVKVKLLKQEGDKEVEGEEREVTAYVFKHENHLEKGEWDFEHFKNERMKLWFRDDVGYLQGELGGYPFFLLGGEPPLTI